MARVDDDRRDLAAWIKHAEPLLARAEPNGQGHDALYMALLLARSSLASGDPRRIASGLRHVSALITYGSELAHRDEEALRRRAGGKKRGDAHAEKTAKRWAPYEKMFAALAYGKERAERLKARRRVAAKMEKDGSVERKTGLFPTRQTLARHFPAK
jgi:hypothetical protein